MADQTTVYKFGLSSYGLITVERLLGHYKLNVPQEDLINSLKKPQTFLYKLVCVPLSNILTGIIRQQAYDFQVYAQKLYVDYLLSGETVKPDSSPGGLTREELETTRLELVAASKAFHELEYNHNKHIAACQNSVVTQLRDWHKAFKEAQKNIHALGKRNHVDWTKEQVTSMLYTLLTNLPIETINEDPKEVLSLIEMKKSDQNIDQQISSFCEYLTPLRDISISLIERLSTFEDDTDVIKQQMRQYRQQFEQIIVTTNELIRLLPDYNIDVTQDIANREQIELDISVTEPSVLKEKKATTDSKTENG